MYILMAPTVKYIGVRSQTISGSIGVIMTVTRYGRLLEWAKIDSETYKSGSKKDYGNPSRAPEVGEKEALQKEIDGLALEFYGVVGKARKLTEAQWQDVKSARIFFGASGVRAGLVDAVMTKEDALKKAKELSGSKLIFTREELRKMTRDAERTTNQIEAPTWESEFRWMLGALREMRAGQTIRIEYRAPYVSR